MIIIVERLQDEALEIQYLVHLFQQMCFKAYRWAACALWIVHFGPEHIEFCPCMNMWARSAVISLINSNVSHLAFVVNFFPLYILMKRCWPLSAFTNNLSTSFTSFSFKLFFCFWMRVHCDRQINGKVMAKFIILAISWQWNYSQ